MVVKVTWLKPLALLVMGASSRISSKSEGKVVPVLV
jgi:hypothetical protein